MRHAIDILARTLYGEARGEYAHPNGGLAALISVGNVIMNRVALQSWFGKTVEEVCQKPFQFSCWNKSDPNLRLISSPEILKDPLFKICLQVAEGVIEKGWPDLTKGADHYHATTMLKKPTWALAHKAKVQIGRHIFYQLR